jgi:hypothetical protein
MRWLIYRSQGLPNFVRNFDIGIGKKLLKDSWPYNIDIALIAHNHRQGIDNLIQLLGLDKKVYLNPETSQWNLFENLGIKVYDINGNIDLNINAKELENNKKIVKKVVFQLEILEGN